MTTEEQTVEPIVLKKYMAKPDDAAYHKKMDEANATIEALKTKMTLVTEKLSSGDSVRNAFSPARQELRSKFDEINKQKNALNEERNVIFEQIKTLQASIKKKLDSVKASKDKLGFKSVADVTAQISLLEKQLESGKLTLPEEKKVVSEISNLNKAKKSIEGFSSQQSTVEADRKALEDLRAKLKETDAARDQFKTSGDEVKAQMDALSKEISSKTGKMNHLYTERNTIRAEMDAAYETIRTLRTDHKKAYEEYNVWYRAEAARKREEYKKRAAEEREEKMRVAAEKELEKAAIPAFTDELALCAALTSLLVSYTPDAKTDVNTEAVKTPSANGRTVDTSMPDGAVMIQKKSDREEAFFVGKKGKKSAKRSAPSSTPMVKPFKLDLELIDQFSRLKVEIPVSTADIPKTLEAIEAKKKYYLENQAQKTLEAKEKALEKIESLKKKALDGTTDDETVVDEVTV